MLTADKTLIRQRPQVELQPFGRMGSKLFLVTPGGGILPYLETLRVAAVLEGK